jgi:hypothetical protein
MNHEEKTQMLGEINEIRTLLMQLNKPGEAGGGGLNSSMLKGKRILDIF